MVSKWLKVETRVKNGYKKFGKFVVNMTCDEQPHGRAVDRIVETCLSKVKVNTTLAFHHETQFTAISASTRIKKKRPFVYLYNNVEYKCMKKY